jgi:hypothetical protein
MGDSLAQIINARPVGAWLLLFFVVLGFAVTSKAQGKKPKPLVLSAEIVKGMMIYKLDGKRVEDSKSNSLLTNLTAIVRARGNAIPVFVIVDVRAPFSEAGKLDTALAKADLLRERKLFVTNFRDGTMNEIHWDETGIPIPLN